MANLLRVFIFFLVFSALSLTFNAQVIKQCEYEMVVNTGPTGGPSYKLGIVLEAIDGSNINNTNIVKNWGAMGRKYTYFLPNSSDRFKTTLPCLARNFCYIALKGKKGELNPPWYIHTITVATKGDGGVDRLKTFQFLENITTTYPDASHGECGD